MSKEQPTPFEAPGEGRTVQGSGNEQGRTAQQREGQQTDRTDISEVDQQEGNLHHGETGGTGSVESVPGMSQNEAARKSEEE